MRNEILQPNPFQTHPSKKIRNQEQDTESILQTQIFLTPETCEILIDGAADCPFSDCIKRFTRRAIIQKSLPKAARGAQTVANRDGCTKYFF
jgi:hypothetical protein